MKTRMHIFKTKTRDELAALTHSAALAFNPLLRLTKSKKPIIMTVDGAFDIGKSLIWDETITKLLGDSAAKIEEKGAESARKNSKRLPGRSFEIWEGQNQLEGKERLRVCFKTRHIWQAYTT